MESKTVEYTKKYLQIKGSLSIIQQSVDMLASYTFMEDFSSCEFLLTEIKQKTEELNEKLKNYS